MRNIICYMFLLSNIYNYAQVGIGTKSPSSNSVLELYSDSKGFLLPRLSSVQRLSIAPVFSNDRGLQVFDTTLNTVFFWNGSSWIDNSLNLYNSDGDISPTLNTPNQRNVYFSNGGNLNIDSTTLSINATKNMIGVGTSNPTAKLEIIGTVKITDGTEGLGRILISDSIGLVSWKNPNSVIQEPWYETSSNTSATSNTQNIYQMGYIGIGTKTNSTNPLVVEGLGSTGSQNSAQVMIRDTGAGNAILGLQTKGARVGWIGMDRISSTIYWNNDGIGNRNALSNAQMVLNASGNLGIGTTAPIGALTLYGLAKSGLNANIQGISWGTSPEIIFGRGGATRGFAAIAAVDNAQFGGGLAFFTKPGNLLDNFPTGAIQTMVMDWNGRVGIGTPSPTALLSVNGTANNTSGTWAVFSDIRSKENIKPYQRGLKEVLLLNPVIFNYSEASQFETSTHVGFIAQEVQKIMPEMVVDVGKVGEIDNFLQLTQEGYIQMLVNAIKEQQKMIDKQELELKKLKDKLTSLEGKLK